MLHLIPLAALAFWLLSAQSRDDWALSAGDILIADFEGKGPDQNSIRLEILVDRTSIEIYADDGRVFMPVGLIPSDDERSLAFVSSGGTVVARSLEVVELRSAWR